jgi:hypothetical protein
VEGRERQKEPAQIQKNPLNSSEQIYLLLRDKSKPVTNYEMAQYLHIKDDRQLQGAGEEPGILERARKYIYTNYGTFLVTNFSGSKLTQDPNEAEKYVRQVWVRSTKAFDSLMAMKKRIADKRNKFKETTQMKLTL